MTVQELIKELKTFDPHATVLVRIDLDHDVLEAAFGPLRSLESKKDTGTGDSTLTLVAGKS